MENEKRSSERHMTIGLMSTVSDGKASYLGVVEDVSANGVCLSQVPSVFDETAEHCFTVVKGASSDYNVVVRPCWAKAINRGMYKKIGFAIDDPSDSWKEFVERIASNKDPLHTLFADSEVEM